MIMKGACSIAFATLLLSAHFHWNGVRVAASPLPHNSGMRKEEHLITSPLPGLPPEFEAGFKQYSGYITLDGNAGRALFYYFVQALAPQPLLKPLTLWLSGGHGCSSVGGGAFVDHGPFRVMPKNYSQLIVNPYSWNRESNMLYVDSPAGAGWSYSNTTSDYNTNDVKTAKDNFAFLLNWFSLFEEYKGCKFFISGVSYAGHYVPPLASLVLEHNKKSGKVVINLQGISGNGEMVPDVCIVNKTEKYLNIPEVQKAFHANTTKLNYPWTRCSSLINYQADTKNNTMIPIIIHLLKAGVRMLIYNGDFDGAANFEGTRRSVHQLSLSTNMHVTIPYSPWYLQNQVAGWTRTYNGTFLTYALVRHAGHSVPNSAPEAALLLFQSFIENQPLPLIPTFTSNGPSPYASS